MNKANNIYQWDTIYSKGHLEICELASAFTQRTPNINEIILKTLFKGNNNLQLFLNSYPTEEGSKDVASNLRFKKDKDINNAVVINTLNYLDFYNKLNTNPIVITSYPREVRKFSFKMLENGDVKVINNYRKLDPSISNYERNLNQFFEKVNLNENRRKRMRYSSEGAKFYTFFADLLSFITQIDYYLHPEMFSEKWLSPNVKNIDNGLEKVVKKFKLPWEPKEGFDYLYFKEDRKGYKFIFPRDGSIEKVSHQMWELLSPEENGTKLLVREHFNNINIYKRWSDYNVNDVDDGITICAIYHAYLYTNDNYKEVKDQLEFIINQWFHSLDTLS